MEGAEQDEFLKSHRGRSPQVSGKRGGLREQPPEADGLGTQGTQGLWEGGFSQQDLLSCF